MTPSGNIGANDVAIFESVRCFSFNSSKFCIFKPKFELLKLNLDELTLAETT